MASASRTDAQAFKEGTWQRMRLHNDSKAGLGLTPAKEVPRGQKSIFVRGPCLFILHYVGTYIQYISLQASVLAVLYYHQLNVHMLCMYVCIMYIHTYNKSFKKNTKKTGQTLDGGKVGKRCESQNDNNT